MKLLNIKVIEADSCGGLLDGLHIHFREGEIDSGNFSPLCLIGPNGAGKSQVLQILAEIFQLAFSEYIKGEKGAKSNRTIQFELEYLLINPEVGENRLKLFTEKAKSTVRLHLAQFVNNTWEEVKSVDPDFHLPSLIVAYTSGDNETLSRPFYASRSRYAKDVATSALSDGAEDYIQAPRMMLIDYGTSLEVLIANLLQINASAKDFLLDQPNLKALHSFRCVIQLKHPRAPGRNGILLTNELQQDIENLKRCASSYHFDETRRTYTFDYLIQDSTHEAFSHFWEDNSLSLYTSFHNLAMLNDLMIQGGGVFNIDPYQHGFSKRLVEPVDSDKVFRFEKIRFISKKMDSPVDYVSLSDGEHQLAQLLGTMGMIDFKNVLFLLDEPESHFNPQWRVDFISNILRFPTNEGPRDSESAASNQECLLTTHSPFVPSDMQRENVLIFSKEDDSRISVRRPSIQTYGSKFDSILSECFNISPPVSALSSESINKLLTTGTIEQIEEAIGNIGESSLRMKLAGKLARLKEDS